MNLYSLFAGIGGFDLAFQNCNHTTVGACEIDEYARRIFSKQFPNVPIEQDATKLRPEELPDFDILSAGFPCQSFSIAGQRRGFDDTRGSLFFEIARIAKEKKPPYLLLENVKGLLSHDKGQTFRTILATLDEMGYDAEWQVLNSRYFVPQNRERIFIIGYLRGSSTRKIFPLGSLNKQATTKQLKQIGSIDTKGHNSLWGRVYDPDGLASNLIAHGGGLGAKTGLYAVTKDHNKLRQTQDESLALDANYYKGPDNHGQRTMIFMAHTKGNIKQRIQNRDESWTLTSNNKDWGVIEPAIVADRSRTLAGKGRNLESPKPITNSITSVSKDNYLLEHSRIRRLTPKECERLQGFPDDYTAGISDTQRYRCLGNAVTVPVVQYIVSKLFG
jgi:DNA (cytosine-5)-methyltransferase 1